jgi:fructose-1,6-bisphosphatase I
MAFLVEEAGGVASDGSRPVLDVVPTSIHQRCPIFLGSSEDVNELLDLIKKHSK